MQQFKQQIRNNLIKITVAQHMTAIKVFVAQTLHDIAINDWITVNYDTYFVAHKYKWEILKKNCSRNNIEARIESNMLWFR